MLLLLLIMMMTMAALAMIQAQAITFGSRHRDAADGQGRSGVRVVVVVVVVVVFFFLLLLLQGHCSGWTFLSQGLQYLVDKGGCVPPGRQHLYGRAVTTPFVGQDDTSTRPRRRLLLPSGLLRNGLGRGDKIVGIGMLGRRFEGFRGGFQNTIGQVATGPGILQEHGLENFVFPHELRPGNLLNTFGRKPGNAKFVRRGWPLGGVGPQECRQQQIGRW